MIDFLGREIDNKGHQVSMGQSQEKIYVVNGVNEDMMKLLKYKDQLQRKVK